MRGQVETPSPKWAKSWLKVQGLKLRKSRALENDRRDACSHEHIEKWFATMKTEVDPQLFDPELTFNVDETILDWGADRSMVVVHHSTRRASTKLGQPHNEHITVVLCVSASGGHVTPTVILPLVNQVKSSQVNFYFELSFLETLPQATKSKNR